MQRHRFIVNRTYALRSGLFTASRITTCALDLPFSNLGLGSIPARNWVWEHAKEAGHKRHWILDDNIRKVYRRISERRIRCNSGKAFDVCETFTDRYTNIGISGLAYSMFSGRGMVTANCPFYLNVHVYSCLLIDNALPWRWRGRYNEDTDLCLQVLAGGLCTVLFNAFLIDKMATMTMKGGNSAQLYRGSGRLVMAKTLEKAWPGVVETRWRFNRPQHAILNNWRKFDTPLIRRSDIDWDAFAPVDEFGLQLRQKE